MEPLQLSPGRVIPADYLSVSFTRVLEDSDDSARTARGTPSVVELRFHTRGCPGFSADEIAKIVAEPGLGADRRGTVRVSFSEYGSRPKNLAAARQLLARMIRAALERSDEPQSPPEPAKRRRAGLNKA